MTGRVGERPLARVLPDDEVGRAVAIDVLRAGGIVALPTDTVYGIAVASGTPLGIEQLFHVKRRPPEKSIALLLGDAAQAALVGIPNAESERLAEAFWPGPLTLVLPGRPGSERPPAPTVGVRLPDHACPRMLAMALGPLPTTSANRSGEPDALDAATVLEQLGDRIDLILDGGRTPGPVPSTVVDCSVTPPQVLREGVLGSARIFAALASGRRKPPA